MSRVSTLTLAQCKQSFATGLGTTTLGTAAPVRDQTSVSNKKPHRHKPSRLETSEVDHSASLKSSFSSGAAPVKTSARPAWISKQRIIPEAADGPGGTQAMRVQGKRSWASCAQRLTEHDPA